MLLCVGVHNASAAVFENFRYEDYAVNIRPRQVVYEAINEASPVREGGKLFQGSTKWTVHYTFRWHFDRNGICSVTDAQVMFDAAIVLPKLVGGDPAQRAEYEKILARLRIHEGGHYDIAKRAARSVDAYIRNLPTRKNCDQLQREVHRGSEKILQGAREANVQYDVATDHGRKQ